MRRATLLALGLTALSVVLFVPLSATGIEWTGWRQATAMPNNAFNEAVRSGAVRQPSNTYSSLAFVFVGLLVLGVPLRDSLTVTARPLVSATPLFKVTFAITLLVTGLGSAFYHASLTFVGQTLDVVGMYLLSTFVVLYALSSNETASVRRLAAWYLAANLALLVVLVGLPELRRWLFAAILLAGLVLEYRRSKKNASLRTSWLVGSAGILIVAYVIWIVDNARLLFDPWSWFQGHAVWHILGAGAALLLYLYYDGEAESGLPWRTEQGNDVR
jgi:hypothetical protein